MPKTVTYSTQARLHIYADATGIRRGSLEFEASNGALEMATIGSGPDYDVNFGALGTPAQRAGFVAILTAAIGAGRVKIGDV